MLSALLWGKKNSRKNIHTNYILLFLTNIGNLGCAVARQKDVVRFEVKVNDPVGVEVVEAPCHVQRNQLAPEHVKCHGEGY